MRTERVHLPSLICLCLTPILAGCDKSTVATHDTGSSADVSVSNSYLEAAARDLLGKNTRVLRLAEPGMCPGHFDVRPRQVEDLRHCRILLRFDFQASLDDQLKNLTDHGLAIHGIKVKGGMCEPSSYVNVCHQVADALVDVGAIDREMAVTRLAQVDDRIKVRTASCKQQIAQAGWTGKQVLCSAHQEAFCRWLGLEVPATFSGSDASTIGDIERAIQEGKQNRIRLVIANLPEGRRLADALGSRLGAPVIVFGNFPLMNQEQSSFDDLLAANVGELIKAAKQ